MTPTLHLLCGKMAAGKSTLAARLAAEPSTVLISEDRWLKRLYPDEMLSVADYVRCAARLRGPMGEHVSALLAAGLSVVLDFPANTLANRAWMRGLYEAAGAGHRLHLLEADDALCKSRLHARNAAGAHEFAPTDAQFELITSHFAPPTPEEGFEVVVHRQG
ncbi:ATP-binding protein [Caulobacter sp. 17J65-9]|uniref:AAA family ATPase n=1 Tax=Caulobacter sp. 17J65-9 TaxID=2709382 RepID=UPI0013CCBE30|nr:ATP-binding protein [Caulobacter sp. 17J65-9]NEX94694.1 ATP-binding protein [Caulobacter sp. 17J65-9]